MRYVLAGAIAWVIVMVAIGRKAFQQADAAERRQRALDAANEERDPFHETRR